MKISRRNMVLGALAGGVSGASGCAMGVRERRVAEPDRNVVPNLAGAVEPISAEEYRSRVARAQALLAEYDMAALVLESGSALTYFTGVRWGRSERLTGAVIPREGEIAIVTPYFEEPSVRESMVIGGDVRTWTEDENPFLQVIGFLEDRGLRGGKLAVEETVRHFVSDGIANVAPAFSIVSGMAITRGCRMYKSPAELRLMQVANDITMAAYKSVHESIRSGMSSGEVSALMNRATTAMGGAVEFSMVLLNEASAYPHGTATPQEVKEGSIILMDCGCSVQGYESDISRTWVFGEPSPKQRQVWSTVKRGQEMALETAQIGVPAGRVDQVVREFYAREGFGPNYETPGLSHRLGHGIGLDGHEPVNFVRGETTLLAPGMCFSNEPGLYIFGEFGVRLEDCLYMTDTGPKLFSELSPSIDAPFG